MAANPPTDHPPIDWTKWSPPGEGDVRSPCPMLNALSNHSILPHSGRGLTKQHTINAITQSLNLSPTIANIFTTVALTINPDKEAHSFDLDMVNKHGFIEHDVSLSRNDYALGDNHTFNRAIFEKVLESYGGAEEGDFESVSKARYGRVLAAKKAHEEAGKGFEYGIKEFVLSYGESALFMGLLGDAKEGKVKLEWVKVLFEEERLPFKEGWRPREKAVTQADMNHMIFKLIGANEHKAEEAKTVGLGTVHAVESAVTSVLPSYCTVM